MTDYRAPVKEMLFVLNELAGLEGLNALPGFEDATPDLAEAVLEEAALLAAEVIAPINSIGDQQGTRVENDAVVVPKEFHSAYQQFVAGGWPGIAQSVDGGGQGLPYLIGLAAEEMWQSACLAWSLCPMLSQGAVRAIEQHGDDRLRALFLEKMVSGEYTGTMNLTEPQAGSDLAAVRTQAVPDGDGYRVSGQKIFITWGDHDMTSNILHLVLARLPDAPDGVKGISLFAVPKRLMNTDGTDGEPNSVRPVSVEHKLGIHGSPTCVMAFEKAFGYLVGEPNNGLACMFTMMNHARLGVGLEGISVAERAYQQALAYAKDRVQGGIPGHKGRVTIIHHADVRRMLMMMKSTINAMRSVAYVAGAQLDHAHHNPDPAARSAAQARVELLTPVVKGWCTEMAQYLTSLAIQVHGGMGYVEETGVAQHFRDARITTIYEGTTGIQANDLVGRKLLRDGGQAFVTLIDDMRATAAECDDEALGRGVDDLAASVEWVKTNAPGDINAPGAASVNLLMLTGTVCGGWQLARAAQAARKRLADGSADKEFLEAKAATAAYYAQHIMPIAGAYRAAIEAGSESLMALTEDQF